MLPWRPLCLAAWPRLCSGVGPRSHSHLLSLTLLCHGETHRGRRTDRKTRQTRPPEHSPDQVGEVAERISNVLKMVDQLQVLDTTGWRLCRTPLDVVARLRADEVTEPNQREAFMAIAPPAKTASTLCPK